jgi:hypothetical protein
MRAILAAAGFLAFLSQTGCIALYHQSLHHRQIIVRDESIGLTKLRQLSSTPVPDSEDLRPRLSADAFGRPVILATVVRKEDQDWEWKETREIATKTICDGYGADTYLVAFTVGLPFLVAEALLVVPLVMETVHEKVHARASEANETVRCPADGPGVLRRETAEVRVPAQVEAILLRDGTEIQLGRSAATSARDAEIPVFGVHPRPIREGAFEIQLRTDHRSVTLRPGDPQAFLAAVQGVDWSTAPAKDDAIPTLTAAATFDAKARAVFIDARVATASPLHRFVLTVRSNRPALDGWTWRAGKVTEATAFRMEIPADPAIFAEPVTLTLESAEANRRSARNLDLTVSRSN